MKYIVDVNAKWMVNVEAESALNAEHKMLDLEGVWGANAYDRDGMMTDCFRDTVQFREFLSMEELANMTMAVAMPKAEIETLKKQYAAEEARVQELEKALRDAKRGLADLRTTMALKMDSYDKAVEKLGKQRI
jgi:hypothetical protein